jgi:hypothetical protein
LPFEYFFINGCYSNELAYGLFCGFNCKHCLIKSLNSTDHSEGYLNDWTGFDLIIKTTINGLIWEFGTWPYASYIAVTPNDQISVLYVY